ncbi:MAG TPA: TonB-dependent receptor, partial [Ignavibacteriaceae bacterium]
MKISVLITILIFSSVSTAFPQQHKEMKISGLITDASTGEALISTSILLYKDSLNPSAPPFSGAVTNQFGFYIIPGVPPSDYFLVARYIGYKTAVRELNIDGSESAFRLNIELEPEGIKLEEVIIKGEQKKTPDISSIDVSPDLLKKLPSISGEVDLMRALQMLPGVSMVSEFSNGLYIRGGSPDQTLTLVDGIIIYNPAHLANFASTFNTDALKDVKLIKGGFPAEYGGRLSSVLDVKLRSGTKEANKGIISLGVVNSHATIEGPIGENATYMFSGRKMYYDFLQKKFDANSSVPRYNFSDFSGKITRNLTDQSILFLSGMYNRDNIYSPPAQNTGYGISWENLALGLNWIQINSNSIFTNSQISYVNYYFKSSINDSLTPGTLSNYFSSSDLKDFDIRQSVELNWNEQNTSKIGFDLTAHNYHLLYSNVFNPVIESDPFAGFSLNSIEASMYLQNEFHISDKFLTNAGLRIYYFDKQKYLSFEPRVSLGYSPFSKFRVVTSFAIADQYLHLIVRNDIALPTDLWYPSTENVTPGKSIQYILGFNYTLTDYFFSVESYYKQMKHLYEFQDNPKLDPRNKNIEDQFT